MTSQSRHCRTVIVIGKWGTAAAVNLLSQDVDFVLQPPFPCCPHEVALDTSRGFLAVFCRSSAANATPAKCPGQRPRLRADVDSLLVWDLHSAALDGCHVGSVARSAFAHFKKCLRVHFAKGSSYARTLGHASTTLACTPSRLSLCESASFVSTTDASSPATSPHPRGTGVHRAQLHTALHVEPRRPSFDGSQPSTATVPEHSPSLETSALCVPLLQVSAAQPCSSIVPLASPLPNLVLLQLDVEKLVVDRGSNGYWGCSPPGGDDKVCALSGGNEDPEDGDQNAAMLCTALSLLHRWGISPSAGSCLPLPCGLPFVAHDCVCQMPCKHGVAGAARGGVSCAASARHTALGWCGSCWLHSDA